jgi:hypothetical protein
MARPVRIGLVFEPSTEMLRVAVEQATLLWGGGPGLLVAAFGVLRETANYPQDDGHGNRLLTTTIHRPQPVLLLSKRTV